MVLEQFKSENINSICRSIAEELANRNLFALRDFSSLVYSEIQTPFSELCSELFLLVKAILSNNDNLQKFLEIAPQSQAVGTALFMGKSDNGYDIEKVALNYAIFLVQDAGLHLDDHVQNLLNRTLFDELGIDIDKDFLTDLSNQKLVLKNHGIIFDEIALIYPHQFLRRHFSSNFVEMPSLLNKALDLGLRVYLRIDPLRKTTPNHYRDVMEFDYWHGKPLSESLLNDKHTSTRTVHGNPESSMLNYYIKQTVFRTDMMDDNIRQFKIEEYADTKREGGSPTNGAGNNFFIQRFAHACYDQQIKKFTHLDGAIRVFQKSEYEGYLTDIESGKEVDEKIGERHKMFLVEGEFDQSLTSELFAEWFRYNDHIQEYFSGIQSEDSSSTVSQVV